MKIIAAIDSFKGTLSSDEANAAVLRAVGKVLPHCEVLPIPVSDGGEGFLNACSAIFGGRKETVWVEDPLGRLVQASYLRIDGMAIIEVAEACGLTLLKPEERNPMTVTSRGVGQLLVHAIKSGCTRVVVGLGGSATCDAGVGMLQVMADFLVPEKGLHGLGTYSGLHVVLASDVTNPLLGEQGAARVFSPQKGASPEMVERLEERASLFVRSSAEAMGFDRSLQSGAGAAGGLGYAFMQYFNAECLSGSDWLLDACCFNDLLCDASLVITGEGAADSQTLMGKLPFRIMERAKKQNVHTLLVAGRVEEKDTLLKAGFDEVLCINPSGIVSQEMLCKETAASRLEACLTNYFSTQLFLRG